MKPSPESRPGGLMMRDACCVLREGAANISETATWIRNMFLPWYTREVRMMGTWLFTILNE